MSGWFGKAGRWGYLSETGLRSLPLLVGQILGQLV